MGDRDLVLGRIRAALADVPPDEPAAWAWSEETEAAARYRRDRMARSGARVRRFVERCGDYRARITRCDTGNVAAAVAVAAVRHAAGHLIAPPDWPAEWSPPGAVVDRDLPPLPLSELAAADGVLSLCALAIAETGTIVLDGGVGQGRRALTLVPDLHICVVGAEQIVGDVPEAIGRLAETPDARRRPLTLISGPSATSDIELARVEGVHGPRHLEVIVVG